MEGFSRQRGNIFTGKRKENQGKIRAKNERRKDFHGFLAGIFSKSEGESWRFIGFFGCHSPEKGGSLALKVEEFSWERWKGFRVKEKPLSKNKGKVEALSG